MVTDVKLSALRPLAPVPLAPQCVSQRGQVVVALGKIDRIVVRRRPGERDVTGTYVMELVLRPESRIPTSNLRSRLPVLTRCSSAAAVSSGCSSLLVEKRLEEFGELRTTLYNIAYEAHNANFCAFCKSVVEWAVWGQVEPGALARLVMNEDKMARTLEKFVAEILDITVHYPTPGRSMRCSALADIPPLVHAFFFGA